MRTVQIAKNIMLAILGSSIGLAVAQHDVNHYKNYRNCEEQSKQPYFDKVQIIGKPWRIYYTWNMKMEDKCVDLTFKNATKMHITRVKNDMSEYLVTQPQWETATLFATLKVAKHQLLLFPDKGAAGILDGVPNITDGSISPMLDSVPLLKFFLKLVQDGKYLLMMDCTFGVASLLSRERPPHRSEIGRVAKSLNLTDATGTHACITNKRK